MLPCDATGPRIDGGQDPDGVRKRQLGGADLISAKDFADALSVEPTLTIGFDPQLFGTGANNGQMIAELQNGAKVAAGFTELAKLISGRSEVKKERKGRLGLKLGLIRRKG